MGSEVVLVESCFGHSEGEEQESGILQLHATSKSVEKLQDENLARKQTARVEEMLLLLSEVWFCTAMRPCPPLL
jgi:hypothetical protein